MGLDKVQIKRRRRRRVRVNSVRFITSGDGGEGQLRTRELRRLSVGKEEQGMKTFKKIEADRN